MGSFACQVEEHFSNLTEIMTVNGLESDYKRRQGEYQTGRPRAERAVCMSRDILIFEWRDDLRDGIIVRCA